MVSIHLCFPDMVPVSPCFPYMVMLRKYLNVTAVVLGPQGRYCDVTMIRPLFFNGIRADLIGSPGVVITDRHPMKYLLHIKVISCIFPWNNSIYITEHNCTFGRLLSVFNKCSGLRHSDTLSSYCFGLRRHTRKGKSAAGAYLRHARRPLTPLGMSAWPYRVITMYSYYIQIMVYNHSTSYDWMSNS